MEVMAPEIKPEFMLFEMKIKIVVLEIPSDFKRALFE